MPKYLIDLAERTFFTAVAAGLGYLAVHSADINAAYAIPIATALTTLKGTVAKLVGNSDSASLTKSV